MGNSLVTLDPKKAKKFDAFLSKYPKLLNKELLTENKLFKTYSFLVEKESSIIMKVYLKRDNTNLKNHENSLRVMQAAFDLNTYPNLLPYTKLFDEDAFMAVVRPKVNLTLSQRIHTAPSLRKIEKLWICFQALTALYNLHNLGFYHGNITSTNLLVTTWNHVFLADYAWYAPNYLREDNLEDKNFFYPTANRKCNLAPEKFIAKDSKDMISNLQMSHEDIEKATTETLHSLQKMDIFSLGCVIAELMLDGRSLFTYEQLLAYRRDEYDPSPLLERIENPGIINFIKLMIKKDPEQRPSLHELLSRFATEIAPESFSTIIYYINSSLLSHNFILPDQRIALIRHLLEPIYTHIIKQPLIPHYEPLPVTIQECQILQLFLKYYQNIKPNFFEILGNDKKPEFFTKNHLFPEGLEFMKNIQEKDLKTLMSQSHEIKAMKSQGSITRKQEPNERRDLFLIALMICSNMRNCRYFSSLKVALEMLTNFSQFFNDQIKLHVIIPYLFSMFEEQNSQIVVAAFNTAVDILLTIKKPIKYSSEKGTFTNYIYPALQKLYIQNDPYLTSTYILRMHDMINISVLFTEETIRFMHLNKKKEAVEDEEAKNEETKDSEEIIAKDDEEDETTAVEESPVDLDSKIEEEIKSACFKIRAQYADQIPVINHAGTHPEIHEALVRNFGKIAKALGSELTEKTVLVHTITYLNDTKYKLSALEAIIDYVDLLPLNVVDMLLKPCFERSLYDADERVVFQSVRGYCKIVKQKKLKSIDPLQIINTFLPLLVHPNIWIREEILELICAVIEQLDILELYTKLQPGLLKYVKKYEVIF